MLALGIWPFKDHGFETRLHKFLLGVCVCTWCNLNLLSRVKPLPNFVTLKYEDHGFETRLHKFLLDMCVYLLQFEPAVEGQTSSHFCDVEV
ncbi:hypothetical protein AVEN_26658-1 [Araneus ventricosus]|uniref:Uncharacterized protein n=1 Tax=Araneus ventricosus TaxID=182803 RepID=A0A4Y2PWW9_ARAVE|nr:hypothetical protein AVEN_26658-1 [Araneus ventricosus]